MLKKKDDAGYEYRNNHNIVVNLTNEEFQNKNKTQKIILDEQIKEIEIPIKNKTDTTTTTTAIDEVNDDPKYYELKLIPIEQEDNTICQENHLHNKCIHGKMNYADPYLMTPLDLKFFKYNYQPNFQLQDYVNWLLLYKDDEESLPYIHLKNFLKIKKGEKLVFIENVVPPKIKTQIFKNPDEYFKVIYNTENDKRDVENKIKIETYDAYNSFEYPSAFIQFQKK